MGRYLTLTNSSITKLGRKKKTTSHSFSVGPVSLKFILIILLSILGLFFIIQSNETSLRGYKISDLEQQKNKLVSDNERLSIEVARLKSLATLDSDSMNLVKPQKVDYLPSQSPVAVKK